MATPTQVPKQTERHTQTNAHRTQKEVSWEEGAEQDSEMKTSTSLHLQLLSLSLSLALVSAPHMYVCVLVGLCEVELGVDVDAAKFHEWNL